MNVITPAVALLCGSLLAGCSDKQDASKTNFRAALDRHFADHCLFVTPSVGLAGFPVTVDPSTDASRFDALVSAGLLTAATATDERTGPLGIGTTRTTTRTYGLTGAGAAAWHADAGTTAGATGGGFCAGHYTVVSVDGFTAPTAYGGVTVSQVSYTVEPHLDGWTANAAVQDRYGAALAAAHRTQDRTTLTLTDAGWAVR